MEHRRGQRKTVSLAVIIDARRCAPLTGEIVDLSVGGAFIMLEDFIPAPNTIIRLSFAVPGSTDSEHQCRALVVRKEGSGVGVMFDRRQDPELLLRASLGPATKLRKPAVSGRRPVSVVAGNVAVSVD